MQTYFRDSVVASLVDEWKARLSPLVGKKWTEPSTQDRQALHA